MAAMRKQAKKRESFLTQGLSFLVLSPMLFLMLPTVVFMSLSMMPTLAALVTDARSKSKMKYKWLCIGGFNFAGALYFLFDLWFARKDIDDAISLFFGNAAFMIIYAAAFIGWIFYRFIPPIVLSFMEIADQRRVVNLCELQAKLIAKWGEDVAADAEAKVWAAAVKKPVTPPPVIGVETIADEEQNN